MSGAITPAVEKTFEYKGFPCAVLMQPLCFRTGYVGIPKGHQAYGKDYNFLDIDCHGGLTYSDFNLHGHDRADTWWIGFDTGHFGDGYDFATAEALFQGNEEVLRYVAQTKEFFENYPLPPMTLEYCELQCRNIVDQLLEEE